LGRQLSVGGAVVAGALKYSCKNEII